MTRLKALLNALREVISAFLVSGESDFLLHVVVPDLRDYERFLTESLLRLPGGAGHPQQLRDQDHQACRGVAVGAFEINASQWMWQPGSCLAPM